MKTFRLHGDNIVECERIADLLLKYCNPKRIERGFASLACPYIKIHATTPIDNEFTLEFFPGFNKSHNDRWTTNILEILKADGCFLDETPDIILTEIINDKENILASLEFCSALQAGNQAWQRSGRAYSVGRTKCPYIYILDFVKYELDTTSRSRKNLRFPNPAVAFSYITHSKHTQNLVAQAYVKAEEFQPEFDNALKDFSDDIFGEKQIAEFLLSRMAHLETHELEELLLQKNKRMVGFLASNEKNSFTKSDWDNLFKNNIDIIDFSKKKQLGFKKKIAKKSLYGHAEVFRDICSKYAIGIASTDLPFGLIPSEKKADFANEVISLYSITDENVRSLLLAEEDLLVCILKGFKPRGDDNRPDRGALPFATMLLNEGIKVLTFLFGPIVKTNATKLKTNYKSLFNDNGLWKSIIGISDLIIVDSPCVDSDESIELTIYNTDYKQQILNNYQNTTPTIVPLVPNRYQENDVDAIIHYIFKYLMGKHSFEGLCNPPGGDWSGLSVLIDEKEYRWLSLPRVSPNGKRPDHVVELLDIGNSPILLVVESKERAQDLENNIGDALKYYLTHLFSFTPSVVRETVNSDWEIANTLCDFTNIPFVSAGAFLKSDGLDVEVLFESTHCDMLFILQPDVGANKWVVEIYSKPQFAFIAKAIKVSSQNQNDLIIKIN
ncbi:MAG: hypothetical protein NC131_10575 [Roseburia sp.]|nr:hypothetical protein [Roseburia sp.]